MSWESYWGNREDETGETELRELHPIWRGIGFVLAIFVPLVAFGLSDMFVNQYAPGNVPGFFVAAQLKGSLLIPGTETVVHNYRLVLLFTVLVSFVMFALIGFLVALGLRMVGGSPTDKLEAPLEKYKPKKNLKKRR